MNRKLVVAAVAAAFVAPAAFAQSSVTIGGTINILWDHAAAQGATNNGNTNAAAAGGATINTPVNNNLKPADRIRDGAGSNIRFSVIEDLGGGNQAFVQVESAVVANSDQRSDALGQGGNTVSGSATAVWGNRNTGVGLNSKTMGRILIGVWDVHYHETYSVDPGWIPGNSAQSILGLFNTFGATASLGGTPNAFNGGVTAVTANATAGSALTIGGRYSNVIRWASPTWGGFTMVVAYARPTDGAPPNRPGGSMLDGKVNRAWNFAPKYENGGLTVQYSYLNDNNIVNAGSIASGLGATSFWGASATGAAGATTCAPVAGVSAAPCNLGNAGGGTLWKMTSNRLGVRYRFANGFGIGAMWDQSKTNISQETSSAAATPLVYTTGNSSSIKRSVWAIPLTYDFGNHHIMGTWARANSWKGSLNGVNMGSIMVNPNGLALGSNISAGSNTGARLWSFGYQYNLSQRTNVSLSYATLRNQSLARYDFFANSTGIGSAAYGADPKTYGIGLRHTF